VIIVEKTNSDFMFKVIVNSLTIPILVIQLDKESNSSIILYFNSAFKDLTKVYKLFPKSDYSFGDAFEIFKVSPGTKLRRASVVLEGLQNVFQKNVGYFEDITISLIKHSINGKETDTASLERMDNQTPHKLTLIKLSDNILGIVYENLEISSGNGFSRNFNTLVTLSANTQGAFILKDNVIKHSNVKFIEMLGYQKSSEIVDHSFDQFVHQDDFTDLKSHLSSPTESNTFETTCRFIKKDRSLIWVRLSCDIFNLDHRFNNSIVCNAVDITEQKKTELALFQTHRMASVGELASGVAHEINNPLFGIMNYAGLIKDAVDEGVRITKDSEEYEFILGIIEESERIAAITSNLSEFSRKADDRDFIETDLEELLQNVESVLKHQLKRSQITVEKNILDNFPKDLLLQKHRIRTALFNMVLNSCQAVDLVKDREHLIKISLDIENKKDPSFVIIKIWDNGIGIEEDKIVKIFDPFYTSNRSQKTGLGLHTVYQIIKDHNGEIRVASKQDQWTEFTIRLPVILRKIKN